MKINHPLSVDTWDKEFSAISDVLKSKFLTQENSKKFEKYSNYLEQNILLW